MLSKATQSDAGAWWWIKGDGVDVVRGIGESMREEWWGDVDLNDGELCLLYQDYKRCLDHAARFGLDNHLACDMIAASESVRDYLTFLHSSKF